VGNRDIQRHATTPPSRQVDVAWTIVRVTEEQASL
jgi:hypothetical protein